MSGTRDKFTEDNFLGMIRYLTIRYPLCVKKEEQIISDIQRKHAAAKKNGETNKFTAVVVESIVIRMVLILSAFKICDYLTKTDSARLREMASLIGDFEKKPVEIKFNFCNLLELLRSSLVQILEVKGETREEKLERLMMVLKDHEGNFPTEDDAWKWVWFVSYLMPKEATLKQVADVFELDFWELLEKFGPEVEENREVWHQRPHSEEDHEPVEKKSTAEFFNFSGRGMSEDDRAYYWRPDGDVKFSKEMLRWLESLGRELDEIEEQAGVLIPTPKFLETLVNTLDDINKTYQRIYCFEEAFYDLIANMHKRRTQAVLLQLQRLAERERGGFVEAKAKDRFSDWELAASTYHQSRLKLKRYLAVLGNPWLRKQWLDIE